MLKYRSVRSPEQREIVRRVEALFALADQIETRYHKAKAHVDKLTQSILAKALRGELAPLDGRPTGLVPSAKRIRPCGQDPNDASATVLLERIRRQRNDSRRQK